MKVRVTTPVPGYSGSVGGVHFANGEAVADTEVHASEVAYFTARGYGVEDLDVEASAPDVEAEPEAEPQPARNASREAWRTWAVDHGGMSAEDAGALSRDELVARFAEEENGS